MTMSLRRAFLLLGLLASISLFGLPARADAQYFGRNKVQYDRFKFQILKTPHFDIYYYPEEADAARQAARMAERWHVRLSRVLQHQLTGRQAVILYASHPAFSQTNVIEGELGEGTGGVTESAQRRVVLPLGATLAETDHVLGHELVHAFQYDMLGPNAEGLPLWFIEGMAEYLSLGSRDPQTAMWLRDAAIENKLPTIDQLDDPRYFPYRFGHAFWAYIGGRWGDELIGSIMHSLSPVGRDRDVGVGRADFMSVIEHATGRDKKTLSTEWHASIRETYSLGAESPSRDEAAIVIGEKGRQGPGLNVGPALSPDGSQIAFLSERSRLSVDLYLADAATGKTIRKLISTAVDPHFESLQFLASAGAWDPAGKQLAVATIRNGRPVLAILDAQKGGIVREIKFDDLGEIFQPAWSPDGNSIAFSAQVGGFTDLFVLNVPSGQTKRLTNDSFGDLQPAWSPDGRRLAFVTDRFSTQLGLLAFGDYGLGVITLDGGTIQPIETGLSGDAINPQWSADGSGLFFLSNTGGVQNAYRLDLATRRATKLTDEITGVAGITPLSSALTVGAGGRRMAFSVFRDSGYEIHIADTRPVATPVAVRGAVRDQGILPPGRSTPGLVTQQLGQPSTGLPTEQTFEQTDYSTHMSLVGVGQQIGVSSMSQFGTYVNGGIALEFSDVLGNHLLGTGVAINGGAQDIAAQVSYLNRTSRLNWGVFGARVPLLSGAVSEGLGVSNGRTVLIQQAELDRQTYQQAGAMLAYPISRSTRIEATTSANRIGFRNQLRTQAIDVVTGDLVLDETVDLPSQASLQLVDVGGALVRDTAAFGGTGPILGQRFRFEVSPTFGSLRMTNVTLDYRHYVMPVRPVTFAARLLHVGRYGAGGEDQRLFPLFLGYPTLVRGYDVNTFGPGDCTPNASSSCPEFDRLVGSRMLVFNGEVRAPLVGLFRGRLDYGPVPIEVFAFTDAGTAWTSTERPVFANGTRQWVSSAGFGARVNVFGYAVAEFNLARPLNRATNGWRFVFNLRPGF